MVQENLTRAYYYFAGGQNDDPDCRNFRNMLAPVPRVLHCGIRGSCGNGAGILRSGAIPWDILACHVQLHVQPYDLLLA